MKYEQERRLTVNLMKSPSPRRAWIEINLIVLTLFEEKSPSPRRAWIEIYSFSQEFGINFVALPTEGVD